MKFSISFISVYMAAMLYGPVAGGFVGAAADIISCIVFPLGALVWEITVMECIYGVMFGLCFYRGKLFIGNIYLRVGLYSSVRFIIDLLLKTKVLSEYGFAAAEYELALGTRLPGCLLMFVLIFIIVFIFERFYAVKFIKMVKN